MIVSISLLSFLFAEFTEMSVNPPPDMTMAEGNFSHLLWVNKDSSSSRLSGIWKSLGLEMQKAT